MYCKVCSDYIGIISLAYLCPYCSTIRRIVLLFGKSRLSEIIKRCFSIDMNDVDTKIEIEKEEDIKEKDIKKSPALDNLMVELQRRRAKIE